MHLDIKGLITRETLFTHPKSLFFRIQHIKKPLYAKFGAFRQMGTDISLTDCTRIQRQVSYISVYHSHSVQGQDCHKAAVVKMLISNTPHGHQSQKLELEFEFEFEFNIDKCSKLYLKTKYRVSHGLKNISVTLSQYGVVQLKECIR